MEWATDLLLPSISFRVLSSYFLVPTHLTCRTCAGLGFIMGMDRSSVVVLDNGGGLLKAGFGGETDPLVVVPNCIGRSPSSHSSKKWLAADQLQADDADVTGVSLRRPIDRGYLINPEVQKEVWDRVLRSLLKLEDLSQSSLLLVEPLFNPPSLQRSTDELVFEEFGFGSLCVADSPSLVHLYEASRPHGPSVASLVVDCGFSYTHAAPVVQNMTLNYGVKRMDLGGKALTNYLKELVSYRALNVMDETLLIDHAKEQLCFVSLDLQRDLRLSKYFLSMLLTDHLFCFIYYFSKSHSFPGF